MARILEINDVAGLLPYRGPWQSLLAETPAASFFQSFDWLETYWRHFGAQQRLRVLLVEEAQRPLGIVPLAVRSEKTRLGRVQVLTYPLDDWGVFYGPIGPQTEATLSAALAYLRNAPRDWDVFELRGVERDGSDGQATARALRRSGWSASERPRTRAALVDLRGDWRDYWAARAPRWRSNVNRAERKLSAAGELALIRHRPAGEAGGETDPRWDLYEACEQLAARSWQGAATDGTTLSHATVRGYLRDAHAAAARAGGVDLNLLALAGRPVAFAYNYHYRGYVYGLRMGYDAAASRDGAGTVLLRRMLEDSFLRRDHTFDLGPGSLECKRHWSTSVVTAYRYTHFAPSSPRAQLLRWKERLKEAVGAP